MADGARTDVGGMLTEILPGGTCRVRLDDGSLVLAYAAGKRVVRASLEGGVRAADRVVDEVAPPLFHSEDMRAGVAGLLEHGARRFRDKVIFQGR